MIWQNPNFKSGEWKKKPQDSGEKPDEGFDYIFASLGRQKSKKPPVFELVAAICHRHIAFRWVRIPTLK